jgi:hypothetical protein
MEEDEEKWITHNFEKDGDDEFDVNKEFEEEESFTQAVDIISRSGSIKGWVL